MHFGAELGAATEIHNRLIRIVPFTLIAHGVGRQLAEMHEVSSLLVVARHATWSGHASTRFLRIGLASLGNFAGVEVDDLACWVGGRTGRMAILRRDLN
jgi:hypothetical protein